MNANDIQGWLSGDKIRSKAIRKQYKLFALILVCVLCYIFIGYQSVKQQHRLTDTKKEMLDAKYQYLTISAEWAQTTRPSVIEKNLQTKGSQLKESTIPPIKIK